MEARGKSHDEPVSTNENEGNLEARRPGGGPPVAVTQVRAAVARTLAGWPRLASMTKGGGSEWMGWIRGPRWDKS